VKHHCNALLPKLSCIPERSARKTLNQSIQALYQLGQTFTNVARLTRILKPQGSIVRNSPARCLGDTFSEQISVTLYRHARGGQNSVPEASCTRNTFKKDSVNGHRNTRLGRILPSSSSPKSRRNTPPLLAFTVTAGSSRYLFFIIILENHFFDEIYLRSISI
jgi:hypothetical protein